MNPPLELDTNAVTAIAQLADQRTAFNPNFHGLPLVAHHRDIVVTPYAHLLPQPQRVRRNLTLDTAAELIIYLAALEPLTKGDHDAYAVIFADGTSRTFTLYPSFHQGDYLSWLDHKALCQLKYSRELELWKKFDNHRFTQEAFAEFIDENVVDIHTPSGAEMLTIAKTLEATRTEVFRSSIKVNDGTSRLTWDNQATGENNTEVPDTFHLAIPIFDGDKEVIQVKARLFYRLPKKETPEAGLTFYFKLHRLDDILEKLWDERVDQLRSALEGKAQVFAGTYNGTSI
jgi:uncharacterized protein YfdQ (DUF2303 family)